MLALSTFDILGLAAVLATVAAVVALPWPKAYTLALGLLGTYFIQFAGQWWGGTSSLLPGLVLVPGSVGEAPWTLLTYAFLHANLGHIAGNLFILVTAGPALEDSTGPRWFLVIYAAGLVAAGLAGWALAATTDIVAPQARIVGASGAIFAVLTAFAVRHPRDRLPIILFVFVTWFPAMGVLLIYLAFNVAYMLAGPTGIAWYGHFAGFLAGLVLAHRAARPMRQHARMLPTADYAGLATTPRTKEALRQLERVRPGEEAVAEAWLDVLVAEGRCPACGGAVVRSGLTVGCPRGHPLSARR